MRQRLNEREITNELELLLKESKILDIIYTNLMTDEDIKGILIEQGILQSVTQNEEFKINVVLQAVGELIKIAKEKRNPNNKKEEKAEKKQKLYEEFKSDLSAFHKIQDNLGFRRSTEKGISKIANYVDRLEDDEKLYLKSPLFYCAMFVEEPLIEDETIHDLYYSSKYIALKSYIKYRDL